MKRILLTILVLTTIVVSCVEENITQQPDSIYKDDIIKYLNEIQSTTDIEKTQKIDDLVSGIDFSKIISKKLRGNEDLLIADIKTLNDFKSSETLKALFFINQGYIVAAHIITFTNKNAAHSDIIVSFFNYTFDPDSYSGKIALYNIFGDIQFFNIIENGELIANGNINGNRNESNAGKTKACIDWYLITTYYYSDGSKRTTDQYLFTTCDDDCNTTRIAGRTSCGGGGGTGSGSFTPGFPSNPQHGDEYEFRDPDNKVTLYKYDSNSNIWTIVYVTLPEVLVQTQSSTYSYLLTDGPTHGLTVFGPDDFIYTFDAWYGVWNGQEMIEVGGPDPFAIPIPDIKAHMKCFDPTQQAQITIYVDQPVSGSNQCYKLLDPTNVGHSFINILQGENSRTVGFYPQNTANPTMPSDPSIMKDNAGKSADVSVSFEITAQELDYLLNYIENDLPNTYDLNTFNCTNWVVEACSRMGINLPQNSGTWPGGSGLCPGQFGENMRNFTIPNRQVTTSSPNQTISAPANKFTCVE